MMKYHFSLFLTCLFLIGCSSNNKAPIEFNTLKRYEPYHKVLAGETIESIAEKYKMTPEDLKKINYINENEEIITGRLLIIYVRPDNYGSSNDVVIENENPVVEDTELLEDQSNYENSLDKKPEFIWPLEGKEISSFEKNKGINIKAPKNTPVKSASSGIVRDAGSDLVPGYGNIVVIEYPNSSSKNNPCEYTFVYAHLHEIKVKKGDKIEVGKVIGRVGKSGDTTTEQLLFQVRDSSMHPIDPKKLINKS